MKGMEKKSILVYQKLIEQTFNREGSLYLACSENALFHFWTTLKI